MLPSFEFFDSPVRLEARAQPITRGVIDRLEWQAELWHVLHGDDQSPDTRPNGDVDATAFCLGAFQDAFWLRRHGLPSEVQPWLPWKNARQCVIFLAVLAVARRMILALLLHLASGARSVLSPYQDAKTGCCVDLKRTEAISMLLFQRSRSRSIGVGDFTSKPSSPTLRSISRSAAWLRAMSAKR